MKGRARTSSNVFEINVKAIRLHGSSQSITDIQVLGMCLCIGTNLLRKQLIMKPILQLGTVQSDT